MLHYNFMCSGSCTSDLQMHDFLCSNSFNAYLKPTKILHFDEPIILPGSVSVTVHQSVRVAKQGHYLFI